MSENPSTPEPGTDTPTGTDPDARYEQPGYEDKSFGQAVDQDQELADRLLDETGGDVREAEERFEQESHGPGSGGDSPSPTPRGWQALPRGRAADDRSDRLRRCRRRRRRGGEPPGPRDRDVDRRRH